MALRKHATVLLLVVIATTAIVDVEPKKHHHHQHKHKLEFLSGERKQNVHLAPTDQEPSPLSQQIHQNQMVRLC